MALLAIALKNLRRNVVRTGLTFLAVFVLVMLVTTVTTVTGFIQAVLNNEQTKSMLIVSEKWTNPSEIPRSYLAHVSHDLPGVIDWTMWNFIGGYLDESRQTDRFTMGLSTRSDNLPSMFNGIENQVDPQAIERFKADRIGCLVPEKVIQTMNWKVGQQFTLQSVTAHGGKPDQPLILRIAGVVHQGTWNNFCFLRDDYFQEAVQKDTVGLIWLRTASPRDADQAAKAIEARAPKWGNTEVKVETQSGALTRILNQYQLIFQAIRLIFWIILVIMTLILANSIAINVRERRTEMAVLKVLGFRPSQLMLMVIAEAMMIGTISAGLGAALVYGMVPVLLHAIKFRIAFFDTFQASPWVILTGLGIGAGVGLAGSLIPAWNARKVRVAEVFSKLA